MHLLHQDEPRGSLPRTNNGQASPLPHQEQHCANSTHHSPGQALDEQHPPFPKDEHLANSTDHPPGQAMDRRHQSYPPQDEDWTDGTNHPPGHTLEETAPGRTQIPLTLLLRLSLAIKQRLSGRGVCRLILDKMKMDPHWLSLQKPKHFQDLETRKGRDKALKETRGGGPVLSVSPVVGGHTTSP